MLRAHDRLPDQAVLLLLLLVVSAAAWVVTHGVAGDHMQLGILTGAPSGTMDPMSSMDARAHSMALGTFMATWLVMMVAMMLPGVAPVVLTFRRWARSKERSRQRTLSFLAGYLFVWGGIGLAAYGVMLGLQEWVPAGNGAVRAGAVLLVGAGVYQFTPLKEVCLRACRSPLSFLMTQSSRLSRGAAGAFSVGIYHGWFCLGCCWGVMVVLVLLGMMNLVWMAAVASLIVMEKVFPRGDLIARFAGAALIILGAWLVFFPRVFPAVSV